MIAISNYTLWFLCSILQERVPLNPSWWCSIDFLAEIKGIWLKLFLNESVFSTAQNLIYLTKSFSSLFIYLFNINHFLTVLTWLLLAVFFLLLLSSEEYWSKLFFSLFIIFIIVILELFNINHFLHGSHTGSHLPISSFIGCSRHPGRRLEFLTSELSSSSAAMFMKRAFRQIIHFDLSASLDLGQGITGSFWMFFV